ncbi:sigma-70 family RNA polymerase sigma factor [Polyangium sp. y55x31]|uniref:sigma-70 family RNA polymerase sigma factor n=1 Tax=Polyangium sp. y55x31 TaxID=3042688 RepID=UPI002482D81F|nr:sigma-70 family RNA polymerase sigma factor [Polyangium sp. y55x31]MDI1483579.1 sigma-70 family RNA polymerase sigma factor [Polyangium sp. y55x31]
MSRATPLSALLAELLALRPDVVRLMARKRCSDSSTLEDRVQETLTRAFFKLHVYEEHPDGPRPWLFGIGRNVVREDRRAERNDRELFSPDVGDAERTASQIPSPEESACRRELRAKLAAAMDRLSDAQYLVLVLVHVGGWSYEEVAEYLGIPLGTVQSRLQAALEHLRREFPGSTDDYLSVAPPLPFAQRLSECMPILFHLASAILVTALALPSRPMIEARAGLYLPTWPTMVSGWSGELVPAPSNEITPAPAGTTRKTAPAPPPVSAKRSETAEPSREELRRGNAGQTVIVNGQ